MFFFVVCRFCPYWRCAQVREAALRWMVRVDCFHLANVTVRIIVINDNSRYNNMLSLIGTTTWLIQNGDQWTIDSPGKLQHHTGAFQNKQKTNCLSKYVTISKSIFFQRWRVHNGPRKQRETLTSKS